MQVPGCLLWLLQFCLLLLHPAVGVVRLTDRPTAQECTVNDWLRHEARQSPHQADRVRGGTSASNFCCQQDLQGCPVDSHPPSLSTICTATVNATSTSARTRGGSGTSQRSSDGRRHDPATGDPANGSLPGQGCKGPAEQHASIRIGWTPTTAGSAAERYKRTAQPTREGVFGGGGVLCDARTAALIPIPYDRQPWHYITSSNQPNSTLSLPSPRSHTAAQHTTQPRPAYLHLHPHRLHLHLPPRQWHSRVSVRIVVLLGPSAAGSQDSRAPGWPGPISIDWHNCLLLLCGRLSLARDKRSGTWVDPDQTRHSRPTSSPILSAATTQARGSLDHPPTVPHAGILHARPYLAVRPHVFCSSWILAAPCVRPSLALFAGRELRSGSAHRDRRTKRREHSRRRAD